MGLIEVLRKQTKDKHKSLEQHALMKALTSSTLDLQTYARALQGLYGPFDLLEKKLVQSSAFKSLRYEYEPRAAFILRDLNLLNVSPGQMQRSFEECTSKSSLVGLLYVLEGSKLGGQVIRRSLLSSLGEDAPASYFESSIGNKGWQNFMALSQSLGDINSLQAADYASQSFDLILAHLKDCS